MSQFPEIFYYKKEPYHKIKDRSYAEVAIYQNDAHILRIGSPLHLKNDVKQHELLLKYGFQVPHILETNTVDTYFVILEEKFPGEHMGSLFQDSCSKNGSISDDLFSSLMNLVKHHAHAQEESTIAKEEVYHDPIHRKHIVQELPHLMERIQGTLEKIDAKLEALPKTLTHGDFNPHNMFPKGFIDFEYMDHCSYGEDIANPLIHIYFFPASSEYEYQRGYFWSPSQIEEYLSFLEEKNILSYLNEFVFLRCLFATVRMESTPKLQAWRYKLFERLLTAYERDEELFPLLTSFPS